MWNTWHKWLAEHDDLVFPISVALGARIVLSVISALIVSTTPIESHLEFYNYALTPVPPTGWNVWIAPFERWDAIWYEIIATRGYIATDPSPVFFPLFPILIRIAASGTNATLFASVLVATTCTALAFVLFYRTAQQLFNKKTARLGLVVWATFPTTFFLFVPYAEALFVLLAMGCLQAARQKHWLAAGIIGGLAALTRSPGVWLVVPLGIEWLDQACALDWKGRVQTVLPLLLVPLGLLLYMSYLYINFGDMLLWLHALAQWENQFSLPWETIALAIGEIFLGDPSARLNNLLDLSTTLFVLGMVVLGLLPADWRTVSWRGWQPRLPLAYGLYGLIFVLAPLTLISYTANLERIPMASAARRAVIVFPAFMMAGIVLQGRLRAPLWIALSLGLQSIFLYIFVRWLWVG